MGHLVMSGNICAGSVVKTEGSWHHGDGGLEAAPPSPTVPRMPTTPHRVTRPDVSSVGWGGLQTGPQFSLEHPPCTLVSPGAWPGRHLETLAEGMENILERVTASGQAKQSLPR